MINVKHAKFLRRDMFLKNILEEFSKRILNKKIVFLTSNVEDVINESHLRILNTIDVHAIRHEMYLKNLNTFFKKDVEFMLIFRLIKIEVFYQFFAFVSKNIFEKVFRSQRKLRKTRRFERACAWHFIENANNVFFENIFQNWRFFITKITWCVVWERINVVSSKNLRFINDALFLWIDDIDVEIHIKIVFLIQDLSFLFIIINLRLSVSRRNFRHNERFTISLRTSDTSHDANVKSLREKCDF